MALGLHRASGTPDWETVTPSSRSTIQKVAAVTRGVVTPGNIVSTVGLGMVIYGLIALLQDDFWLGFIFIAAGRALDIVDGLVAEATQTKSPLGEMVDAAFDKIGTVATIIVLFTAQIAPWWVLLALLLPQVVIPLVIFYNRQRGVTVHPSRAGKLSMALTWVGIAGLLLAKATPLSTLLVDGVYSFAGISLVLGLYALWQYATGRD